MPPLLTVQALRALAAIAVTLSHLVPFEPKYLPGAALLPRGVEFGQCGVDLFFVISGYIMVAVTAGQSGSPAAAGAFLRRRILRIYPIYWVYLLLLAVVWSISPQVMNARPVQPDLLASVLLLPHVNGHLLLVSWTLVFEMFFYLVFAVLLALLPGRWLAGALLAWAGLTVAGGLLLQPRPAQPWLNLACNPLVLEFIAGALLACILPRLDRRLGLPLLALGAALLAGGTAAFLEQGPVFPVGWPRVLVFGSAATLLLAGSILLEPLLRRWIPRWLVALGDASYSLYLGHLLVIGAVGLGWRVLLANPWVAAWVDPSSAALHLVALGTAVLACLLASLASYRLLEAPMQRRLRAWSEAHPVARMMARRLRGPRGVQQRTQLPGRAGGLVVTSPPGTPG